MTAPSDTNALKPCPFCGGPAALDFDEQRVRDVDKGQDVVERLHAVNCRQCYAGTQWYHSQADATIAWNHRVKEDPAHEAAS